MRASLCETKEEVGGTAKAADPAEGRRCSREDKEGAGKGGGEGEGRQKCREMLLSTVVSLCSVLFHVWRPLLW